MSYRVGIIGATGAVGQDLLNLLHERSFPCKEIRLFASARSAGKTISCGQHTYTVETATPACFENLDLALFSAGAGISKELAPEAVRHGCVVVDNSSAFRMEAGVPLIIPEINAAAADNHVGIIANPNCSTAITLMGLYPLHLRFGLVRFFAATYQAVSGSGVAGIEELEAQTRAWARDEAPVTQTYPHPIAFNLFPQVDSFLEDGYTKEEHKMVNESRKIMGLNDLKVSTTCVRVPVLRAHSIAVNAEFRKPVDLEEAREALSSFPGTELRDDPAANRYPTPLAYAGRAPCGVGRLRRDTAFDNGLSFFVVGDQILKGAALNAVQIAETLHERKVLRVKGA